RVDVGQQVGAARDRHRARAFAGEDLRGLGGGARRAIPEPREPHHEAAAPVSVFSGRLISLPSPPSQGGGTTSGSGYGTAGKRSGPPRRASPSASRARARTALTS